MFGEIYRKTKETFNHSFWVIKLFWKITPGHLLIYIVSGISIELVSVLNTYVFAKIIDVLLGISNGTTDYRWIYGVLFTYFFISVIRFGIRLLMNYSSQMIRYSFEPQYNTLVYEKMSRLDIGVLEKPSLNNLVERTRSHQGKLTGHFYELTFFLSVAAGLIASGAVVFSVQAYFIPLFILANIPIIFLDRKYLKRLWEFNRDITEDRRKAFSSAYFLQDAKALQELKVTAGYKFLSNHFMLFTQKYLDQIVKIRSSWYTRTFGLNFLKNSVEIYAVFVVFQRFFQKLISIGDVTFYIGQISNFINNIDEFGNSINSIYEGNLSISEVKEFFETKELEDGDIKLPKLEKGPDIAFQNVSFTYPRAPKPVIKNLNLKIKSGEKIAIVGHNGAGKTTLIKLLLRFYKVDDGEILINNKNINNLKIDDYYKNVSALFQDYNAYTNLNVEENIVIGRAKTKPNKVKLKQAARMADVDNFVLEYEKGYKQILSEKYKNGIRPSTGQWQKIAIARFFYRNSPLVIFDEPTAAIDAVAEAKIFNKIYSFFKNKTVIIISHRFSTVRNADRIIVFEKGKIVEQGSHEELIKMNGKYAGAFALQAEGYR